MLFKKSNRRTEPLLHELNIIKFDKLELLKMGIFMWKVLDDEVLKRSKNHISIRERIYGNHNLKLYLPIVNTNLLKRDIYQGPKLWLYPPDIRSTKRFPAFKLAYNNYLLYGQWYVIFMLTYIYIILYTILYTTIFTFTGLDRCIHLHAELYSI